MSRELVAALADLGLNPTEAALYAELVRRTAEGPVSAYKLARALGRDPANTTKVLAALERRGAVHQVQAKPRAYRAVPPEDFTGTLVAHLGERRETALRLLRELGGPGGEEVAHPLLDADQVLERAIALLQECRTLALVDAAAELLPDLAGALAAAARRDVAVLVKTPGGAVIPGVRVWPDPLAATAPEVVPGAWLHLVTDGEAVLTALVALDDGRQVLHGAWHRIPPAACLAHRGLAGELIQAATRALQAADLPPEKISRRTEELARLLLQRLPWRERWEQRGWTVPAPPVRRAQAAAAGDDADTEAAAPDEAAAGPLQFVFRRKKRDR